MAIDNIDQDQDLKVQIDFQTLQYRCRIIHLPNNEQPPEIPGSMRLLPRTGQSGNRGADSFVSYGRVSVKQRHPLLILYEVKGVGLESTGVAKISDWVQQLLDIPITLNRKLGTNKPVFIILLTPTYFYMGRLDGPCRAENELIMLPCKIFGQRDGFGDEIFFFPYEWIRFLTAFEIRLTSLRA